jgi:hypothetical protein
MYSSPRDMMAFLAANLDEMPVDQSLHDAMALAHRKVFRVGPLNSRARKLSPLLGCNSNLKAFDPML